MEKDVTDEVERVDTHDMALLQPSSTKAGDELADQ